MAASPALTGPFRLFSGVQKKNLQQWGWTTAPCPTCLKYWRNRFQKYYEDHRPATINDTVAKRIDQELVEEAAASHRMPVDQTGAVFDFFNTSKKVPGEVKDAVSWSVSSSIATNFMYFGGGMANDRMEDGALLVGGWFFAEESVSLHGGVQLSRSFYPAVAFSNIGPTCAFSNSRKQFIACSPRSWTSLRVTA